ncbi:DJ-1/PfpI family protein [Octadecabacter sp. G9-8]|uniref:DJ-1/PfpI family protein n=1 Tax=Octadecabacter dasysiphoniae TaxID=2909341 RepID=A0ABS9CVF0_9RHOB|nr:DJ-1/PfpI family protein [Octadecabacter dasysiphoniae]MCF2870742.1 DJ-1/PfpI family protein [Octadecabacter dasysiphoniae]
MDKRPRPRTLDVFIFEGVNILDVAGPVQAFDTARFDAQKMYHHRYVSLDGRPVRASCGLTLMADGQLSDQSPADDLLIPGGGVDQFLGHDALLQIVAAKASASGDGRIISICSGALILAAAGVLDACVATTHWRREAKVQTYPNVLWDLDRISTESERIYTSAGVTTGIDLALAIIRQDCGNAAALEVAREMVVQLRRTGGQSQYAMHLAGQFTPDDHLTRLIENIVAQPERDWTLDALATGAGMNSRTLSRRFNKYLDLPPAQFVEKIRVDHARGLLSDNIPLQTVAVKSGFGDLQRMRRAFQRRFGINLGEYLSVFGPDTHTKED